MNANYCKYCIKNVTKVYKCEWCNSHFYRSCGTQVLVLDKHNITTFCHVTESEVTMPESELEIALRSLKAFFKEELQIFKDEIEKKYNEEMLAIGKA